MSKGKLIGVVICVFFTGILTGFFVGKVSGAADQREVQKRKTAMDLKVELKEAEEKAILEFIQNETKVSQKDEGGLFTTKYVNYLEGRIFNTACVATIKHIKINLEFLSTTGSVVGSQDIILIEFIRPNHELVMKEKLKWPKDAEGYRLNIVSALVHH